ncbi:MAG TPA: FGGY-family carbohydrate kinase, partial [Geminicoccaceae bacterium]|nr:FGGY-family carbohydrate kinase [Geminicoccaceae bacterium]
RAHLVRALLEGVAFGLRDGLALMRDLGVSPEVLRAVGGGTRSRLWREIMAASLEVRLQRLAAEEGPAMGAALLALVGVGVHADVEVAVAAAVHPQGEDEAPDPDLARRYASLHERFRRLYPALKQAKLF